MSLNQHLRILQDSHFNDTVPTIELISKSELLKGQTIKPTKREYHNENSSGGSTKPIIPTQRYLSDATESEKEKKKLLQQLFIPNNLMPLVKIQRKNSVNLKKVQQNPQVFIKPQDEEDFKKHLLKENDFLSKKLEEATKKLEEVKKEVIFQIDNREKQSVEVILINLLKKF